MSKSTDVEIDNTSYYRLPNGRYLEEFIMYENLNFAEGNALKYLYRAGKKPNEPRTVALAKAAHYIGLIAQWSDAQYCEAAKRMDRLLGMAVNCELPPKKDAK